MQTSAVAAFHSANAADDVTSIKNLSELHTLSKVEQSFPKTRK